MKVRAYTQKEMQCKMFELAKMLADMDDVVDTAKAIHPVLAGIYSECEKCAHDNRTSDDELACEVDRLQKTMEKSLNRVDGLVNDCLKSIHLFEYSRERLAKGEVEVEIEGEE